MFDCIGCSDNIQIILFALFAGPIRFQRFLGAKALLQPGTFQVLLKPILVCIVAGPYLGGGASSPLI